MPRKALQGCCQQRAAWWQEAGLLLLLAPPGFLHGSILHSENGYVVSLMKFGQLLQ